MSSAAARRRRCPRCVPAFAGALGDGAVLRSAEEAGEFRDPYAFASWAEHWPSAVLMPGSVQEVQAVVRIAGRYRVPLWTNSMGKNNAYGGGAPRLRGSVVLSLRRMNRILEVNEELAFAVVEPGVSFFDLCAELRRRGSALWASIPDLGWGSVCRRRSRSSSLSWTTGTSPWNSPPSSALKDYDNFTRGPLKAGDVVRITSFVHYDLNSAGLFSAIRVGSYG